MPLTLTPIQKIPLIKKGDNLPNIIWDALLINQIKLIDNDILVITQKVISKAEGRSVNLSEVHISEKAREISKISNKNPHLIELILQESNEVLRVTSNHIIVEHRLGFVCANAGIDHSNVDSETGNPKDSYLLLPKNPDSSAQQIKKDLEIKSGVKIGILIIDSHGRAWRNGIIGTAIGIAGMPGLIDFRGKKDIFGYKLRITQIAAADELASAASLIMGQADEKLPIVHVRGFPYPLRKSSIKELIRLKEKDLFR
jgi:coenzyme F420-0:L-glutamate ligase / coenzyme F420-1:gamma-L-glutamate ligase